MYPLRLFVIRASCPIFTDEDAGDTILSHVANRSKKP